MNDIIHFNLDADLFLRVRKAQSDEETRYYLHGVYVEPDPTGGALLVATDGRAMLVAHDPKAEAPRSAIIMLTMPEAQKPDHSDCEDGFCCIDLPDYTNTRLHIDLPENGATVACIYRGTYPLRLAIAEEIKGKFPNWRAAITKDKQIQPRKGHQAYGINAALLGQVTDGNICTLESRGDGLPTIIHFDGAAAIFGVIMPCALAALNTSRELLGRVLGEGKTSGGSR